MTGSQLVAGRWVLPTVESNNGGVARMHVSVAVPEMGGLDGVPMDVSMSAAGQALQVTETPSSYYYLRTLSTTAVADFAFDNPTGSDPDTVTVGLEGESATFQVTVRPPDDPGADIGPLVS